MIWYGLTNDACNPGSIWCCWNRVVFASIFFWFDWNTTYAANSKYDTHQLAVHPWNLSNLIKSANCIQLYPHGCGLIHPRSTFKSDQVICNVALDVSPLFLSNSILAVIGIFTQFHYQFCDAQATQAKVTSISVDTSGNSAQAGGLEHKNHVDPTKIECCSRTNNVIISGTSQRRNS